MTDNPHPNEDVLVRFASDAAHVDNADEIQAHLSACAECRNIVDTTHALEEALRSEQAWRGQSLKTEERLQTLQKLRRQRESEDEEAARLLESPLRSAYTFLYANIAVKPRYRTGGVVRLLITRATTECEREPLYALSLAEAAREIALALPDDLYPAQGVSELRGDAWKAVANASRYLGRLDEGFGALAHAEEEYRKLPTPGPRLVRVMNVRATLLWKQQRYAEAIALARRTVTAAASYGETNDYRTALQLTGVLLMRTARHSEARDVFMKLRNVAQRSGDTELEARLAVNLGSCYWEMGEFAPAGHLLLGALRMFEELDRPTEALRARWSISRLALATGRPMDAVKELRRVVAEMEARGMTGDAALAQLDLAEAHIALGLKQAIPFAACDRFDWSAA